jgi:hypothetical protein
MSWPYGRRWAALVKTWVGDGTILCSLQLPGCTRIATTLDHYPVSVQTIRSCRPDLDHLAYDPANTRPACQHCNIAREMRRARRQAGRRPGRRRPRIEPTRRW